jgi:transcription elongation factor Elf1
MPEQSEGWYSGRIYCPVCGSQGMSVWPAEADEQTLECGGCGARRSVVISRTLNEQAVRSIRVGGTG